MPFPIVDGLRALESVRRALCDYASINLFLMVANERPRDCCSST